MLRTVTEAQNGRTEGGMCRPDSAGANGLVRGTRRYQPGFDLEQHEGVPNLKRRRSEKRRLDWVAVLCERMKADVAIPGGVHMGEDVMQSRIDGAKAARMTAALLKNGVPPPKAMRADIEARMEKYACPSIHRRQAIMRETSVAAPAVFGRADCMKRLWSSAHREQIGRGRAADLSFRRRERVRCAILNERAPPWWKAAKTTGASLCLRRPRADGADSCGPTWHAAIEAPNGRRHPA